MISPRHIYIAKQAIKLRLPFANTLRRMKRSTSGYRPNAGNIALTFADLIRLNKLMRVNGERLHGTVLEIGTGWFPINGILAHLAGAERVILTDITPHMDQDTFMTAKQIVMEQLDEHAAAFGIDAASARARLLPAKVPQDLGLDYQAPFDITKLEAGSLNVVMSRACLEHIPVPDLRSLCVALRPCLRPDGFMAHAIDNTDHLSHFDPSITRMNFLTWTEARHRTLWRVIGGGENRLRHHEYASLFEQAGYTVVAEDALLLDKDLNGLKGLRLMPPYDVMKAEQLAASTSWFFLRPSDASV